LPTHHSTLFFQLKRLLIFKGQLKKIKSCSNAKKTKQKAAYAPATTTASAYARKKTG
jgi:hypothetical protein